MSSSDLAPRPASASCSELIRWMSIQDANSAGFIHGGVVMRMSDEAAGIAAIRHSGTRVVTAGMDRMTFAEPIYVGELLRCIATVNAAWQRASIQDKGEIFNYDLTEAVELGFLIDLAETLVVSALARTESRGAHFRDDHPTRDDANWMKHSLAFRTDDGDVRLDYKSVVGGKYEPMERKY